MLRVQQLGQAAERPRWGYRYNVAQYQEGFSPPGACSFPPRGEAIREGTRWMYQPMGFGAIPLAATLVISAISQMVTSRVNAATAAQRAAAEFNYFQDLSEGELTQISYELARKFPQYPYWEWFSLLRNLRNYGMLQQPEEPLPRPMESRASQTSSLIIAAVVGLAVVLFFKV